MRSTYSIKTYYANEIRASLLSDIQVPPGLPDYSHDIVFSPQLIALHAKALFQQNKASAQSVFRNASPKEDEHKKSRRVTRFALDYEDPTLPKKKVFCEKKLKKKTKEADLGAELKPRKSFCIKDLNAHNFFESIQKQQETGELNNPRRPQRQRSRSVLPTIPLSGSNMTEECTLEQGQALKYLRILGKKLRAHYFFHSTPMAST